jgi:hypothetical protein
LAIESYLATAGLKPGPEYLSVDWILGLFSTERDTAQRRYQAFVEGERRLRHRGISFRGRCCRVRRDLWRGSKAC